MRCSPESRSCRALLAALGVGALLGLLSGCEESESESEPQLSVAEATQLEERPCPPDSVLSYENFGAPFFLSWCNGCHAAALAEPDRQGAPMGSDYDDLESIRADSAAVWLRAGDHNLSMPPLAGPEDEDRTRLGEWLSCGAPTDDDLQ